MPANIASCCTCDMHVHFLLTFHLPRCHRALRAPLKPHEAVQRIYRDYLVENLEETYSNFVSVGG